MDATAVLRRLHNPHGHVCACSPDCWCNRTMLGRAVKWWFPGHLAGLHHKNAALEGMKRDGVDVAEWKRRQHQARD